MISTNDFRTGVTITLENDVWQVIEFQHVKTGRGGAFVRSKLRNLKTGSIQEKTFRAGERLQRAHVEHRKMQYLYASGATHTFMDMESYEQIELQEEQINHELKFLKENMEVSIIIYEGEVIGVQLPNTVELEVIETEPGIRGDTASGGSKPATLETGLVVQVPFFINQGDILTISTVDGEYLSRS